MPQPDSTTSSPTVQPLPPGALLKGRYRIERELGHGGIGVVYLARDERLHSMPVVVKFLLKDANQSDWLAKKFMQEAEALARISHPGVVRVLDRDHAENGKPFFVMEFINGKPLRSVMRPEGMNFEYAAMLIRQIGHALQAAHREGIFHRDLKPENIMLETLSSEDEQIKLIDFGIAKVSNSDMGATTQIGIVAGSLFYMSPEQLLGGAVTSASDIYSFGIIAYEMLTGRRPFNPDAPNPAVAMHQLLTMHQSQSLIAPQQLRPSLPEAAQAIILNAFYFDAAQRPQDARQFGDALASALTAANMPFQPSAPVATQQINLLPTLTIQPQVTSPQPAKETSLHTAPQPVARPKRSRLRMALAIIALLAFAAAAVLAVKNLYLTHPESNPQVSNGQRYAEFSKPAVVRIFDGYLGQIFWPDSGKTYQAAALSSGSGAFINPNGYIATNAHLIDRTHQGADKGKEAVLVNFISQLARDNNRDPKEVLNNREMIQGILAKANLRSFTHIHHVILPNGDNFPFEIKAFGAPVGDGKDVSIIKIEVKNAPVLKMGDSDKVQLQDHITAFGYPAAADTNLLNNKSALEASITDGMMSARKNAQDGAPILQVSAPASHGNSGGPVLNDKGEVIGMLTFRGDTVNGQEVQGFTFVIPSSTMQEFIKQAGTDNEEGVVNRDYREGLELYWNGRYTQAIQKFQEVARLYPQHSETARLIRDSQQAIAEGKEKAEMNGGLWLAGGFLALAVICGGLALAVRRKAPAAPVPGNAVTMFPPPDSAAMRSPQPVSFSTPPPSSFAAPHTPGMIVCVSGPLTGRHFEITAEGFYLGRDPAVSQVVIDDARVSSRHAWIGIRYGRVVVIDQGSTNGTFVNSINSGRIQEAALNLGDTVIIAGADVTRLTYQQ